MDRSTLAGKFIVIEGGDGSGKGTQVALLKERVEAMGIPVRVYDFPRYDTFFGQEVARLLRGEYGPLSSVDPFLAALLYAGDRLDAAPQMRADLSGGCFLIANRYVSSNLAHGGAKYRSLEEAARFVTKVEYLEYAVNCLPRADLQLFLDVPAARARLLLAGKGEREYMGGRGVDLAEADLSHQEKAVMMYRWLCENKPYIARLDCTSEAGELLSIEEIHQRIWSEICSRFVV